MEHGWVSAASSEDLLRELIQKNGWTVEELAEAIGDSPLRMYRVLEGEELLGKAAELAALALYNGLNPVEK